MFGWLTDKNKDRLGKSRGLKETKEAIDRINKVVNSILTGNEERRSESTQFSGFDRRKLTALLLVLFMGVSLAQAGDYGRTKPIVGPPGPAGQNGTNGEDADGQLSINLGLSARLYDAKYWQINSAYTHDVYHGGNALWGLVGLKIGKSYEQKEMKQLRAALDEQVALTREIQRKQVILSDKLEIKKVEEMPDISDTLGFGEQPLEITIHGSKE